MVYSRYSRMTTVSRSILTFAATRTTLAKLHTDMLFTSTAMNRSKLVHFKRKWLDEPWVAGECFFLKSF